MMPASLGTSVCSREPPCPCSCKCWSDIPCAQSWCSSAVPLSSWRRKCESVHLNGILEGCRNWFSGSADNKQSPESLGKKGGKSFFSHCGKFMAFWIWVNGDYISPLKTNTCSLKTTPVPWISGPNAGCGMGGWGQFSSLWGMYVYIFNRNGANISVSSWTVWVCRKTLGHLLTVPRSATVDKGIV